MTDDHPDRLDDDLLARVLAGLGLAEPPAPDLAGLRAIYGAWCARVPFDNVRKMIALLRGEPGPLPGTDPAEFLESWLAHGTSGTCWPTSGALHAVLVSLGFGARRVAGCMRDLGIVNHGSVKVRVGGGEWLADSSLLTVEPMPLGCDVHVRDDAVVAAEIEPEGGTHVLWALVPPTPAYMPCRITVDPVDAAFCAARYEESRGRSPFNQRLYARRNRPDGLVVLLGRTRFEKTAAGVAAQDLDAGGLLRSLRGEIGLSAAIVDAWVSCGGLGASFAEPSGPQPPPLTRLPPSLRRTA